MASTPPNPSRGSAILHDPRLNKGTAFTEAERDRLGLRGLLPPRIMPQPEQQVRVLENFRSKATDLERYIYLAGLLDRNERLFYRVVMDHIEEMMPIIYTPTVGEACRRFGHIFRRPRGLYITAADRGRVATILQNWPEQRVGIVVVTDGERILGLGDLGANGMGIPIGKLSLYTACAGVDPALGLPVMLDVGTERDEYLDDPLYLGLLQRRLRGQPYLELVDEFVEAVERTWPGALIQFEDFATANAITLLARYRDRVPVFNDDIQGTAAVTLAGLLAAGRITGRPLSQQRVLFFGAGSAASGIADLLVSALRLEGMTTEEASRHCWMVDRQGLLVADSPGLLPHQRPYAHPHPSAPDLLSAIALLKPSALVGVSAQPGSFTQPVIQAMASYHERPVIFPLSNPTSRSECTAQEAYAWSDGRAVFASGSPFGRVEAAGRSFLPAQANNAYIFPGVGLGVLAAAATRATDEMFYRAARCLADQIRQQELDEGRLFPPLQQIRPVSERIAVEVATLAWDQQLARTPRPADIPGFIESLIYRPDYDSAALRP